MRLYRLYNLTELGPACGLYFFRRETAEQYKDLVRWPYQNDGRWPLPDGRSLPLDQVDLRVEVVERPVAAEPLLDAVVWEQEGLLGWAPLLPGDCFDPDEWTSCPPEMLAHPVQGPRLEQLQQKLHEEKR